MLIEALKAKTDYYHECHRGERDEQGRSLVMRNGRGQGRKLTLGAGTPELKGPRIDDRRGDDKRGRRRLSRRILPPFMRRSLKVAEILPIRYSCELSTGDFRLALEGLLGADAVGRSPTKITRLTACRGEEDTVFRRRDLAGREYVYVWIDGVHFKIRLEDVRLCTLVTIGARPHRERELLAVEATYRESAESWKALPPQRKRRRRVASMVAVRDSASGFWAADARGFAGGISSSRCSTSCRNRLQSRAKRALHEMINAECRADCEERGDGLEQVAGSGISDRTLTPGSRFSPIGRAKLAPPTLSQIYGERVRMQQRGPRAVERVTTGAARPLPAAMATAAPRGRTKPSLDSNANPKR